MSQYCKDPEAGNSQSCCLRRKKTICWHLGSEEGTVLDVIKVVGRNQFEHYLKFKKKALGFLIGK